MSLNVVYVLLIKHPTEYITKNTLTIAYNESNIEKNHLMVVIVMNIFLRFVKDYSLFIERVINSCAICKLTAAFFSEHVSTEINNIPSSPVRCYRPISEQTDSDIDYKRQFPSNSRTRIHSSKRRRYQ